MRLLSKVTPIVMTVFGTGTLEHSNAGQQGHHWNDKRKNEDVSGGPKHVRSCGLLEPLHIP